jgi:molybdenum cofactor cytidylyltransferase
VKFGPLPVVEAAGAILAHGVRAGDRTLKKGRVLGPDDIAALTAAGVAEVTAARLELDDMVEDEAARTLAEASRGAGLMASAPFTGRCNLYATVAGLLAYDPARLDRLNLVDEAVTLAALPPFSAVEPRTMAATLKIIPFAAPRAAVATAAAIAVEDGPLLSVAPFRARTVGLVQTRLPQTKSSVLDATTRITEERLRPLGGRLIAERRCAHDTTAVAAEIDALRAAGAELVLLFGASAVVDRRDVLPAAIERAGGTVEHFGMPVDPGNLLLFGRLAGQPVVGMPGCARSPKLNGFDWVLERLFADLPVDRRAIMGMGAGGLLKEIVSRPQPREGDTAPVLARAPRIAALVLAAGRSTRMGGPNKLLAPVDGKPMVRRTVETALASQASDVVVVTGHDVDRVTTALDGCRVRQVHNPRFAEGLSTSLARGLDALDGEVDGVLVCLGDMPLVSANVLNRLIAAFDPVEGRAICLPSFRGKRGNPVLWARRFFAEMKLVQGDVGARHLIGQHADELVEVEMTDDGVLVDVDTPTALAALAERQPT